MMVSSIMFHITYKLELFNLQPNELVSYFCISVKYRFAQWVYLVSEDSDEITLEVVRDGYLGLASEIGKWGTDNCEIIMIMYAFVIQRESRVKRGNETSSSCAIMVCCNVYYL